MKCEASEIKNGEFKFERTEREKKKYEKQMGNSLETTTNYQL